MQLPQTMRRKIVAGVLACVVGVLAVVALDGARFELQTFTIVSLVVLGGVLVWAPGAARRNPPLTRGFIVGAFVLHLAGSLARYGVIQWFYNGVSDSKTYFTYGKLLSPAFRSFEFPPLPPPGTEVMKWIAGLIFSVTGDSLLGGFAVCATLSFFGAWFFYKAFRVAFPEGDARLFALLIFLLPSMWYWPTSLGKDAIVAFFLGITVYGVALIFRSRFLLGVVSTTVGMAGVVFIRPPLAAVPVIAAAFAVIVQPIRYRSMKVQLAALVFVAPILLALVAVAFVASSAYVGNKSLNEAYEQQLTSDFQSDTGGDSNYQGLNLLTPAGIPAGIMTANLRPFPWEAGGLLPAVAAIEGVYLAWLVFVRRRSIARALYRWKDNPMTVFCLGSWIGMSLILSSLTNFGLLARQRTQVLPFLLFLIAAVADNARGKIRTSKRPEATGSGTASDLSATAPPGTGRVGAAR